MGDSSHSLGLVTRWCNVELEGVDLVLAVGAGLDGAGGGDFFAWAGQGMGAEAGADVYGGEAGEGDALGVLDDEVGVAVAVGVDSLYVDDAAYGFAAGGVAGRAVRGKRAWCGPGQGHSYKGR
jgi:hypothetical protein